MKASRELQAHLFRTGLHTDPASISQLLLSYSSNPNKARLLFNQIQHPTTFLYNSMIRSFSQSDRPVESIHIYNQMRRQGVTLNNLTFIFLIKACTRLQHTAHGRHAHLNTMKLGFASHLFVSNSLIHMYGACEDLVSARRVFDEIPERDLVSWNSLICGCSQSSQYREVLRLFEAMQVEKVKADAVTMVKVVLACNYLGDREFVDRVIDYIESNEVEMDVYLGNTLIDLYGRRGSVASARIVFDKMTDKNIVSWNTMIISYAKAGNLGVARELFDRMPVKDVISWTSLITSYSQSDRSSDALKLFREMMVARVKPDEITVVSVLSACSRLGTLDVGKAVHEYIYAHNIKADVHVGNSLIDMYLKCGSIEKAIQVFEEMLEKDTVSWTSLITGLAVNGYAKEALEFFSDMLKEGVLPSDVTFVGVLVACTHAGLVDEGLRYFESMKRVHRIEPTMKHYGCVVDLLSRSGFLGKAHEFIKTMPVNPDAIVWRILLSACKLHDNVALAEIAVKKLLELDPSNSGNYVLLSNAYAGADRWADSVSIRNLMCVSEVEKKAGYSSVEVK